MGKGGGQTQVRVSLWGSLTSDGFTTRMRRSDSSMSFASEISRRAGRMRKPRNYFLIRSAASCVTMLSSGKAIGYRLSRRKKAEAFGLRQLLNILNPLLEETKYRVPERARIQRANGWKVCTYNLVISTWLIAAFKDNDN